MRIYFVFLFLILLGFNLKGQILASQNFSSEFETAYTAFPDIPRGILEGVAYAQTRITHITGNIRKCKVRIRVQ